MKLADLDPQFVVIKEPGRLYRLTDVLDDPGHGRAQGIQFLCPACFVANGGSYGTHAVRCWFRGHSVPDDEKPGPARWAMSGTGLADLTLTPSVLLLGGCGWHGFVTSGSVTTC